MQGDNQDKNSWWRGRQGSRADGAPDVEAPDYSGSPDYSRAKDYSSPKRQGSTANALSSAEDAAAKKNTSGTDSKSRDISAHERSSGTPEPEWKTALEAKRAAARAKQQKSGAKGGFFSKTRNKIAVAVVGAIVGVLSFFIPSLLGLLGINQFYAMIQQHFGVNMEVVISKRINAQFYKQIQDSDKTPSQGGVCGEKVRVACRYKGMSERKIKYFERVSGAKVHYEASSIPGRMKVNAIEFEKGKLLTPDKWEAEVANNSALRRVLRQVTKPRLALWFNKGMSALFNKLGIDKLGGFIKEKTVDKIKEKIKARQKGVLAGTDINSIDPEKGKDLTSEQEAANKQTAETRNGILGESPAIRQIIADAENLVGGKATLNTMKDAVKGFMNGVGSVASGAWKSVAITGYIDTACTILNIISAMGYISKALGSEQLIRFVQTFQSSFDGLRAGQGTAAGFQALGEMLFTPDKETGKSAFESYGYSMMSGNGLGDALDTMAFRTGGGFVGTLVDIKNMISDAVPGSRDAVRAVCGVVQNFFFRAGSFVVGIIAGVASGSVTIDATIVGNGLLQLGLSLVLSFMMPIVTDMMTGDLVGADTKGEAAGNALTSGGGALYAQAANKTGLSTMTKDQAVNFAQNVAGPYLAEVQADERAASSPLDITNPYSLSGSMASGLLPYLSNSPLRTLANLASLAANPFGVFSTSASASAYGKEDYYGVCGDDDYADMNIAADPFCNPVYGLSEEWLGAKICLTVVG